MNMLPKLRCFLQLILLLCLGATELRAADPFPRISGERLSGSAVTLPDGVKGQPTLLIISFSKSAQAQTAGWGKRLKERKPSLGAFDFLQLLELEDVPRPFRGFVNSSLKKSIAKDDQSRFVLIFEGTNGLKAATEFNKDEEAYVVLLNPAGVIQWREHGTVSDQKLEALETQLHSQNVPE